MSPKEQVFLMQLRQAMSQLSGIAVQVEQKYEQVTSQAEALVGASVLVDRMPEVPLAEGQQAQALHPSQVDALTEASSRRDSSLSNQAMDSKILKASILNGAIALLPEKLSTLGIIYYRCVWCTKCVRTMVINLIAVISETF